MKKKLFMGAVLALALLARAETPRAFPVGQQPDDQRLGKLRSCDGSYFPMQPVTDIRDWPARREAIRMRILVAAGLHPLPQRTPLHAEVFGKVERDDYTVERVSFESFPGHFVTGSLFRPKTPTKQNRAAVLCPHGHWNNGNPVHGRFPLGGRFYDAGEENIRKEIASGAERFEVGGQHVVEARCVQLARMGCVVLAYDMEGYADSLQLPHAAGPRLEQSNQPGYLFFSPQAELHGQTMFGLQTWNSLRALDFICSLPGVDTHRIAVTGASGGATQSMMLAAIDERIAACFPACMVSTAMQGGCTCENAAYLRINQGNIDIAAAVAPRPLGLTAADDWTKELQSKGDPDLRELYARLGHPENYEAHFRLEFPHNYNAVNRQYMYAFMNRHLKLGLPEPIFERDYLPLDVTNEASVWTAQHPKPAGDQVGESHERKVTVEWTQATETTLKKMSKRERRRVIAEGLMTMIGRLPGEIGPIKWKEAGQTEMGDLVLRVGTLTAANHGEQLPALFVYPKTNWNHEIIIWLTDTGKAGLFGADGSLLPSIAALAGKGFGVASVDLFGQGEFVNSGSKAITSVRMMAEGKGEGSSEPACYTFGYNPPLPVQRTHDVMSLVEYLRGNGGERKCEHIHLAALGREVGAVGLMARFQLGKHIDKTAIDTEGFDFQNVNRLDDPMFLPGVLRYGGMKALWLLDAPYTVRNIDSADVAARFLAR